MSRIPLRYRLRVLLFYWRRVLLYALTVSLMAGGGVGAYRHLVEESSAPSPGRAMLRLFAWLLPVILATIGHWLGVLIHIWFHNAETPLFLNAGWSPRALALSSWLLTLVSSGIIAGIFAIVGL